MSAPGTPSPPPPPGMWARVARRALRRLGLPLLGLALLLAVGVGLFVNAPSLRLNLPGSGAVTAAAKPTARVLAKAPSLRSGQSELRLPLPGVSTLDPGLAYDAQTIPVIQLLFEGLTTLNEQGELVPRGAERWDVSPDGRTYTFHLNTRARWSDGQPVRAQDYVFAWRRNVNPETGSPYAPILFALKNGEAIHSGRMAADQLGVEALDDRTLVATLESPASYFPMLLAIWPYYPLRQDLVEQHGEAWSQVVNLVGNGAFMLQPVQGQLLMVRNPEYDGPPPGVDRIVFRTFQNNGEALEAFRKRELDIMPYASVLEGAIASDPIFQRSIKTFPLSNTVFLAINNRRPALQDARVRRALGMALDRQALVNQLLGGVGEPASSVHPEGIMGRDPSAWPAENAEEARRLLREAGYPNGEGLELVMAVPSITDPLGPALQQRWRETLGVALRLVEVPNILGLRQSQLYEEQVDFYYSAWQSDYEDPHNWFNLLWDSRNDPSQYSTGWQHAEFDRLVRQAQGEQNPARREELYRQAERIMGSEYPLIPLYHRYDQYLVRPEVQNFNPGRTALTVPLLHTRTGGATPL